MLLNQDDFCVKLFGRFDVVFCPHKDGGGVLY